MQLTNTVITKLKFKVLHVYSYVKHTLTKRTSRDMRGTDEYYYESLSEFTQEKQQQLVFEELNWTFAF